MARLAGHLESCGVEVETVDLNLALFRDLFHVEQVRRVLDECGALLREQERSGNVDPAWYSALARARLTAPLLEGVEHAVDVVCSTCEPKAWNRAAHVLICALRAVNARYFPSALSFHGFNPGVQLTVAEVAAYVEAPPQNPVSAFFTEHPPEPADLCGVSVAYQDQLLPALLLAKMFHAQGARVCLGGSWLTHLGERVPRLLEAAPWVDTIVVGPGEVALERLAAGERDVPGAWNRRGYTRAEETVVGFPRYTGLDRYLAAEPVLPVMGSVGCYWGKCAYCAHHGGRRVARDVGEVLDEVSELQRRHGARFFYFTDDAMSPAFLRRLSSGLLERGLDIRWFGDARPEELDAATISAAAESGLCMLFFGVETAGPRLREAMQRGGSLDRVRAAIEACHASRVMVKHNLVWGLPGETAADREQTVAFVRATRARADVVAASPFLWAFSSPLARDLEWDPDDLALARPVEVAPPPWDPALLFSTWGVAELSRIHRVLFHDALHDDDFVPSGGGPLYWQETARRVPGPHAALPVEGIVRVAPEVVVERFHHNPATPGTPLAEPMAFVSNEASCYPAWPGEIAVCGLSEAMAELFEGPLKEGLPVEQARAAVRSMVRGEELLRLLFGLGLLQVESASASEGAAP